ncbi:MAG: M56 family metallopeptidase, partial [Erythrobacter sp.]
MNGWLIDTLLWSGALIALVLLVRRRVAQVFGPRMAYALWALPMARLLLPPITLPAWLGPAPAPAPAPEAAPMPVGSALDSADPGGAMPAALPSAPDTAPFLPLHALDWEMLAATAFALWIAGAVAFLAVRFRHYFVLRAELLAGAREVGRIAGPIAPIRLLETQGTSAPLAFGVFDPVIALPPGFMARPDRTARDLALEHEIAHHRGHDLLINIIVQPLFAAHWFNPLARYGWLALRRDQEAACDARVIAACGQSERAAYARLIASMAAGADGSPGAFSAHAAITAPMACPVLGEKSIIHRLRSLKMSDLSPRRRMAGRLAMGAAVLALPLTASISYAGTGSVQAPEAPKAPSAPATPGDAPQPPVPPEAPATGDIERVDPDSEDSRGTGPRVYYEEESEYVTIVESDEPGEDGKRREVIVKRVTDGEDATVAEELGKGERAIVLSTSSEEVRGKRADGDLSEEEIEAIMSEVREGLAKADQVMSELPEMLAGIEREADFAGSRTVVEMQCDPASEDVATTVTDKDGVTTVKLCQARVMKQALEGIREARRSIAA